jgi:metal-responsive CopG/Arc/MetJ family transcriptional regulator
MTKRRVQLIFPERTVEQLDRLKGELGASSRAEVLKIALDLLNWAIKHLYAGEKIAAVKGNKIAETIIIPGTLHDSGKKGTS